MVLIDSALREEEEEDAIWATNRERCVVSPNSGSWWQPACHQHLEPIILVDDRKCG